MQRILNELRSSCHTYFDKYNYWVTSRAIKINYSIMHKTLFVFYDFNSIIFHQIKAERVKHMPKPAYIYRT
jgi:hypothetical protein